MLFESRLCSFVNASYNSDKCSYFSFVTADCLPLNLPNGGVNYNTTVSGSGLYSLGTMANFTCNTGFNLIGSSFSICQRESNTSSIWSPSAPICQQGNKMKQLYNLYQYRKYLTTLLILNHKILLLMYFLAVSCLPIHLPHGRAEYLISRSLIVQAPAMPVNGSYPPGTWAIFRCDRGYRLKYHNVDHPSEYFHTDHDADCSSQNGWVYRSNYHHECVTGN